MMRLTAEFVVAALLIGVLHSAFAGPLRDLVRERAAERRQAANQRQDARGMADEMYDDGGAAGVITMPPGARVERDLAYGPDHAQRLDVYLPAHAENAPVIFMVHGGAWMVGDKAATKVVKNKVAHWLPKGYIMVMPDYRMSPQADPLEQANDVAKALAYAQSKARSWGGDPSRIVVMGHSAGAHLVSLLTSDPSIAARQGAKPWLGTVSLDSAAYDVVKIMEDRHYRFYDRVFKSDHALWRESSPTLRLKVAPIPMLLVCSTKRGDSCPQANDFASRATSLGGRVTVLPLDMTHAEINDLLGSDSTYTHQVDLFLRSLGLN